MGGVFLEKCKAPGFMVGFGREERWRVLKAGYRQISTLYHRGCTITITIVNNHTPHGF